MSVVEKTTGPCHYCGGKGRRVAGEEDGLTEPLHLCAQCTGLLRNPATAMQLIRGDASLGLRGVVPEREAARMVDALVVGLSGLRPKD